MLDGVWRTVGGRRIFIKKGQSLTDAMKSSGKFKVQKDDKNIKKQLKSQFEKNKKVKLEQEWAEINEDDFNIESRNRIVNTINELNKKYEDAFDQDYKLRISAKEMDENTFAYMDNNGQMVINKNYSDNLKKLKDSYIKSSNEGYGQKVPEGKELEGIIVHEFGHYYQNKLYQFSDEFIKEDLSLTEYSVKVRDTISENFNKSGGKHIENDISLYGLTNSREWFAESFLQNYYYEDGNEFITYFKNNALKGGK